MKAAVKTVTGSSAVTKVEVVDAENTEDGCKNAVESAPPHLTEKLVSGDPMMMFEGAVEAVRVHRQLEERWRLQAAPTRNPAKSSP